MNTRLDTDEALTLTERVARAHEAVLGEVEARREIEGGILRAEFVLHYQPIVDLRSGRIAATEALARWNHPHKGTIPPSAFIPVAEATGAIKQLGGWVLREAVRQATQWAPAMSVNVSALQFADDSFVDEVRGCLARSGLPPNRLMLEITESSLVDDPDGAAARMQDLKRIGVRIAVDDFGTGYSSLGYLARFPVDALKIDRIFVVAMQASAHGRALTEAIIRLGRTLGVRTIAEGIETLDQLEALRSLRCDGGQGYHFARPMPATHMQSLLAQV